MLDNPYLQYRRAQTETAEPGELVVLLYQGAISFLQRSLVAMRQQDYALANVNIVRAEEILAELSATLDKGVGEVAINLARIYDYTYWRLVEANCKKDPASVHEVLGLLQELLPAWQEAVRIVRRDRATRQAYPAAPAWVAAG